MKLKKESSLHRSLKEIFEEFPFFKVAEKDDYPALLDLLEDEGMKIDGVGSLHYSRKPDFLASFQENSCDTVMITDKTCSFFCAISEIQICIKGSSESVYYVSDFRIDQKINWRTKATLRKAYIKLLKKLDKKCFTAIINSNAPAVQTLTSKRSKLNYREYFNYRTESILISPFIKLTSVKYNFKVLPIKKVSNSKVDFFLKKQREGINSFSNNNREDDAYVILNGSNVIAYLSIKKPFFRKIFITPSNKMLKLIFAINRFVFGLDYAKKIPCTYATQFLVDKNYNTNSLLCMFLNYFYKENIIKAGHVFMLSHNYSELSSKLSIFLFQITIEAKMYNLSNYDIAKINNIVLLDSTKL